MLRLCGESTVAPTITAAELLEMAPGTTAAEADNGDLVLVVEQGGSPGARRLVYLTNMGDVDFPFVSHESHHESRGPFILCDIEVRRVG